MLKLKKQWLFILSVLMSGMVQAQTAGEALTQLLLNTHTMQADFTQTSQDQKGTILNQSQGHMAIQRPGKFRWEVYQPHPQLIIANGVRLWIYDPDLEQVTIRAFSKAAGQTPALLLSDSNLTLDKDFRIQAVSRGDHLPDDQVFRLLPKEKDSLFESVTLSFVKKQIREMELVDHLGHITVIAFQHVVKDGSLPASLFTFVPPPDVDVIDETKKRK